MKVLLNTQKCIFIMKNGETYIQTRCSSSSLQIQNITVKSCYNSHVETLGVTSLRHGKRVVLNGS